MIVTVTVQCSKKPDVFLIWWGKVTHVVFQRQFNLERVIIRDDWQETIESMSRYLSLVLPMELKSHGDVQKQLHL